MVVASAVPNLVVVKHGAPPAGATRVPRPGSGYVPHVYVKGSMVTVGLVEPTPLANFQGE